MNRRIIQYGRLIGFCILIAVLAVGCAGRVVTSGNFTLRSGETVNGDLIITSGDTTLEQGSHVTGSVFTTSGDTEVNGEIDGDIVGTSGTIYLGPHAVVHGNVSTTSQIRQAEGARVEGEVSSEGTGFNGSVFFNFLGRYCVLPLIVLGVLVYLIADQGRRRSAARGTREAEAPAVSEDPTGKLSQLKEMLDAGLITEAEYEAKKADILSRL